MRILVVGGGSGGHLTPALAILEALALKESQLEIIFVCDKKFAPQARRVLAASSLPITLRTIAAGKLRRYHGVAWWRQLLDVPTLVHNIVDLFLIGWGLLQSWGLLGRFQPDVVFAKGGFVCLPVGLAAHWRHIPLVLHDSDAHPGLTNRVLARYATFIATGAPLEHYPYDRRLSRYVGIPVGVAFKPITAQAQLVCKRAVMSDPARPLVVITGGGLGAQRLNTAAVQSAIAWVRGGIEVIHIAGATHGQKVADEVASKLSADEAKHYHVEPFVDGTRMANLLKAADVVVSRAGATVMAELAMLAKATILVPNPMLTGGHQLKNAAIYAQANAAEVVHEDMLTKDITILQRLVIQLVADAARRTQMGQAIRRFAKPQAAADVAEIILEARKKGRKA